VAFLFLCDIINTVCDIVALYATLIRHFGDFNDLNDISWVFDTNPALTGIIVTSSQLFFARRIHVLTKKRILSLLIVILATVGGVCALLTAVKIPEAPEFSLLTKFKVTIIIWLSSEVLGDILITISLVNYLSKHRTGFQQTDLLIDRIIRTTIQTGLITAIVATLDLFLYTLNPGSGMHLVFNFTLCKLYSNSLMSTLNSRGLWMKSSRNEIDSNNDPMIFNNSTVSTELFHSFPAALPSPNKPATLFDHLTAPRTEMYVNVESVELQDLQKDMV